jgi:RHS repeat-associated protein
VSSETANSNLLTYSDSIMGTWTDTYDSLNRLSTATPSSGPYANHYGCWSYDSFGNRTSQSIETTPCPPAASLTPTATYIGEHNLNASNQVTWSSVNSASSGFTYDAAGDVTDDGANYYAYDGDGRLCAVVPTTPVGSTAYGYQYDASGTRVATGTLGGTVATPLTSAACNPATNGFTVTKQFLLGLGGEQVTELDTASGSTKWVHTNAFVGGKLIATYDTVSLHFPFADPLGTKRVQVSETGAVDETCQSLPFGDGPPCTGDNATENRFTGKERDSESGNDYFAARYYSSAVGRWYSGWVDGTQNRVFIRASQLGAVPDAQRETLCRTLAESPSDDRAD